MKTNLYSKSNIMTVLNKAADVFKAVTQYNLEPHERGYGSKSKFAVAHDDGAVRVYAVDAGKKDAAYAASTPETICAAGADIQDLFVEVPDAAAFLQELQQGWLTEGYEVATSAPVVAKPAAPKPTVAAPA